MATLAIASIGRASAGTTITTTTTVLNWTTNTDWLNIENSTIGTFTNNAFISDGLGNPDAPDGGAVGVHVRDNSTIDHFINGNTINAINNALGNNFGVTDATAMAVWFTGPVGLFTNNGTVDAFAHAVGTTSGTGDDLEVEADARGVEWDAHGDTDGIADLINNDFIRAQARAQGTSSGTWGDVEAEAEAKAVDMWVTGNGDPAGTALARVVNNEGGEIIAEATAKGLGNDDAETEAEAVAIEQTAMWAERAETVATNAGSVVAKALSEAEAIYDNATAEAFAAGILQEAEADNSEDSFARARATNTGWIDVESIAFAESAPGGFATAASMSEAIGIGQEANDAEDAAAFATNNNWIGVVSRATSEIVFSSYAGAFAGAGGILQRVDSAWPFEPANVAIAEARNTGTLDVLSQARVAATYVGLGVTASDAIGIGQDVTDGWGLTSALARNTGALNVVSDSLTAVDRATYALSFANGTGIGQEAWGYSDEPPEGSIARATAINTGSLNIFSSAAIEAHTGAGTYQGATRLGFATADAHGIWQDVGNGDISEAIASNRGFLDVGAVASAKMSYGTYVASAAHAHGVEQYVDAGGWGPFATMASASFKNTGEVNVFSGASTQFEYFGFFGAANAYSTGLSQEVYDALSIKATFDNEKNRFFGVGSSAYSEGFVAEASAFSEGVTQDLSTSTGGGDPALAEALATNKGTMSIWSGAEANGTYVAFAGAGGLGIGQGLYADGLFGKAVNSSLLSVTANATAIAAFEEMPGLFAQASTYVTGIAQNGGNYSSGFTGAGFKLLAQNTGDLYVGGTSYAEATYARAEGNALGIGQSLYSYGNSGTLQAQNSGGLYVGSTGEARANIRASASNRARGVDQVLSGFDWPADPAFGEFGKAVAKNTGFLSVESRALARGLETQFATYAQAGAGAQGIDQEINHFNGGLGKVVNSSLIDVYANSRAKGQFATAIAFASGIEADFHQVGGFGFDGYGEAYLRNKKNAAILAEARSRARGLDFGFASAFSIGVNYWSGDETPELRLNGENKGLISSIAKASATGSTYSGAYAQAIGVGIWQDWDGGFLGGKFKNSGTGTIYAGAFANADEAVAHAIGILDPSNQNNAKIVNRGDVVAYAETKGGEGVQLAFATGIAVFGWGDEGASGKAIVKNHGDIWAGQSTDGGKTIFRGNAINTHTDPTGRYGPAPNKVVIQLQNSSPAHIFGNIDITADDVIQVTNGITYLDGIINPDMLLEGHLRIRQDGKLVLQNQNDLEGPSHAFIDTFKMGGKGTLGVELTPDDSPGSYPTVNANSVELGGALSVIYLPGFYGDKMYYDNVIASDDRTGKFKKVVDNSAVLLTKAIYQGDNVDLKVTRQGFGDVKGLTKNQSAAGDAIEKVYGKLKPGTDFTNMVQNLILANDGDYPMYLDQLAGAEYAQFAQSLVWSTGMLNRTVTDRMDCGLNWIPGAGSNGQRGNDACFEPGQFQMWGRVGGSWNTNDGDANAPGYDESQGGFYVGGDYAFNEQLFFGIAGGYFTSDMDCDKWGGRGGASIDYDGGQIALYGGWDNSRSYFRNIVSAGFYSGNSNRDVGIGASPVDPMGSFDASVVSYYGEVGHRYAVMNNTTATPFFGLGLASAGISSFTEKDPYGTGAALKIRGTDASSVATTLGVRVNGTWGAFNPELSLAWRHEFNETQTVNASFAGAPNGADFKVQSSDPGADALLLGLGGAFAVNQNSDIVVRYDGTFLSDYTSHEVMARWTSKF